MMDPNQNAMQPQPGEYPYNQQPGEPIMQPQYENTIEPGYKPYEQDSNPYNNPVEKLDEEAEITYMIRRGFIIKTYGILISQLIITSIFICLSFVKTINEFIKSSDFIRGPFFISFLIIFIFVTIFVCIMFSCFKERARRVPLNYILLLSFTLCMSFYCFIFCAFFDPQDVIVAALLTVAATVGLTVYAIKTTTDFSFCGGFLFCFGFLFVFSFAFYFWIRITVLWLMIGVLIYSLYLIYDTQLIIGNVGIEYSIDDYCFAALNLYIDIIYLFLKILQIVAALKGK